MEAYVDSSADETSELTDIFDDMETTAQSREENTFDVYETPPPTMSDLKPQIEYIKLFIKEIRAVADDYSTEVNQRYEPGSWQAECAAKLKIALTILGVLVKFLEMPGGQTITEQLLARFTLRIKTFAELLGPVMASFSISLCVCSADKRLHKSTMERFRKDIDLINFHMERLKLIMPRLTNMIAEAGEQLKAFIRSRHETGMQEEPNDLTTLFLKISAELYIASNRLRVAESCLVKVQRDIAIYKRNKLVVNGLLTVGVCTVSAALARYTDMLTWRTAGIVSTASVLPLMQAYVSFSVDIDDVLVKIREKEHAQGLIRLELEDLERRLSVLQKNRVWPRVGGSRARYVSRRCDSLPIGARAAGFAVSL